MKKEKIQHIFVNIYFTVKTKTSLKKINEIIFLEQN